MTVQNQTLASNRVASHPILDDAIESLSQGRHRHLPIVPHLPGIAGIYELDDDVLLRYLANAVRSHRNDLEAIALASTDCDELVRVNELIRIGCAVANTPVLPDPFPCLGLLGVAGCNTLPLTEVFSEICLTLYNIRQQLIKQVGRRLWRDQVHCAHALVIAESVVERSGFATDLEKTKCTRVRQWARTVTAKAVREDLRKCGES